MFFLMTNACIDFVAIFLYEKLRANWIPIVTKTGTRSIRMRWIWSCDVWNLCTIRLKNNCCSWAWKYLKIGTVINRRSCCKCEIISAVAYIRANKVIRSCIKKILDSSFQYILTNHMVLNYNIMCSLLIYNYNSTVIIMLLQRETLAIYYASFLEYSLPYPRALKHMFLSLRMFLSFGYKNMFN